MTKVDKEECRKIINGIGIDIAKFNELKRSEPVFNMASRMMNRKGYWLSIYDCLTLQYWCMRNCDDNGAKFWNAVRALIKRDWSVRI